MLFNWKVNFHKFKSKFTKNISKLDVLNNQNSIYFKLNLDRKLALNKLNKVLLKNFNKEYDENNGMWSEHLLLFSALSISNDQKIKNILEIGTFNGETAFILSKLFPDSNVVTIDLNNDKLKTVKEYSYAFESSETNFILNRDKILNSNRKIEFIPMNSLNLFNSNKKFDLIWIDGAHGFPYIAVDLANSLRMINPDGFIMCDDVYVSITENNMITDSMATYITLQKFQEAGIIKFDLVPKRLNKNLKYVAFVKISKSSF